MQGNVTVYAMKSHVLRYGETVWITRVIWNLRWWSKFQKWCKIAEENRTEQKGEEWDRSNLTSFLHHIESPKSGVYKKSENTTRDLSVKTDFAGITSLISITLHFEVQFTGVPKERTNEYVMTWFEGFYYLLNYIKVKGVWLITRTFGHLVDRF